MSPYMYTTLNILPWSDGMRCCRSLAWALFVFLLSIVVCFQPTELIWAFFLFHKLLPPPPPLPHWQHTAQKLSLFSAAFISYSVLLHSHFTPSRNMWNFRVSICEIWPFFHHFVPKTAFWKVQVIVLVPPLVWFTYRSLYLAMRRRTSNNST